MLVYRMENTEGVGPFVGDESYDLINKINPEVFNRRGKCDSPFSKKIKEYGEMGVVFGCNSPDGFNEWFPHRLRKKLEAMGFQMVILEVPDDQCTCYQEQVMFPKTLK